MVPELFGAAMVEQLSARGIGVLCVRSFDDRTPGDQGRMWLTTEDRTSTHQWEFLDHAQRDQQLGHIAETGETHRAAMGTILVSSEPLLLVCTNGKRDVCCAQVGRDILSGLVCDQAVTLECTHIGGHRFAGVTLLLPWGYVHRVATSDAAAELITSAREGRLRLDGLRGRTGLSAPQQVAEINARNRHQVDGLALDIHARQCETVVSDMRPDTPSATQANVSTDSEIAISIRLGSLLDTVHLQRRAGQPRPESCGGDLKPLQWWHVID